MNAGDCFQRDALGAYILPPGYRWLQLGETICKGDRFVFNGHVGDACDSIGWPVQKNTDLHWFRVLPHVGSDVFPGDRIPAHLDVLPEGYRRMEHGEEIFISDLCVDLEGTVHPASAHRAIIGRSVPASRRWITKRPATVLRFSSAIEFKLTDEPPFVRREDEKLTASQRMAETDLAEARSQFQLNEYKKWLHGSNYGNPDFRRIFMAQSHYSRLLRHHGFRIIRSCAGLLVLQGPDGFCTLRSESILDAEREAVEFIFS